LRVSLADLAAHASPDDVFGMDNRSVVPLHKLGHLDGNMASIKSLKLVCQACGSRNWKATLFARQHEVEAFTAS
jgi:hypothetical protein